MAINAAPDVTWSGNDVFQTTSVNIPRPASGITTGMVLFLGITFANTQSSSTGASVAGWTQITGTTGSQNDKFLFWKVADATDASGSGNWVCTCADGFIEQWSGMGWAGVNTSSPFALGPSASTGSSTTFSWASLTSPGTGSIWAGFSLLANNSTSKTDPTPPPTNRVQSTSGSYFGPATGYSAQVDSGAFAPSGTEGAGFEWATVGFFLNPSTSGATGKALMLLGVG